MKKVVVLLVAVMSLGFAANAQKAIGIRGAFGSGSGAEVSYMMGINSNRLELDLGWYSFNDWGSYMNLTGIYQWKGTISGNFGWYAGIGANVGLWMDSDKAGDSSIGLGFDAQAGLEYDCKAIPLQITLDARPQWDILGAASGFGYGIALGFRYMF